MLKQASVSQVRKQELTKNDGYLVIAMRFYPRGLKKELWDEYRSELAPQAELFKEWKEFEAEFGHEAAFEKSDYESRFELSRRSLAYLEELSKMSQEKNVYLICQCDLGERCHREMLLLMAQKLFHAQTDSLSHSYPVFEKRIDEMKRASPSM